MANISTVQLKTVAPRRFSSSYGGTINVSDAQLGDLAFDTSQSKLYMYIPSGSSFIWHDFTKYALKTDLTSLTSSINTLSSNLTSVSGTLLSTTGKLESVYSTVALNSGSWSSDLAGKLDASIWAGVSSYILDAVSTLESNSGDWETTTDIVNLSSYYWDIAADRVLLSADVWDTVSGKLDAEIFYNSPIGDYSAVVSVVSANSATWNTVSGLSAKLDTSIYASDSGNFVQQGSDQILRYEGVYSTVASNSSYWQAGGGGGGGSGSSYIESFTSGGLVSGGYKVINHNLNNQVVNVVLADDNYNVIVPSNIYFQDANTCILELSAYGSFEGTWHAIASYSPNNYVTTNTNQTISGNKIFNNDVTVYGTFTANSGVFVTTESVLLSANFITLNEGASGSLSGENAGMIVDRGDEVSASVFMWHGTEEKWKAGISGALRDIAYFDQLTGKLDTSIYHDASGNWENTYTTFASNSALWGAGAVYVPLTGTLSGNGVSGTITPSLTSCDLGTSANPWRDIYVSSSGRIYLSGSSTYMYADASGNINFSAPLIVPTGTVYTNSSYAQTFTSGDLISGILVVNHNLNQKYVHSIFADNTDKLIIPDEIIFSSTNQLCATLTSFGVLTGDWNAYISK